jgi:hypothetical protein
MTTVHKLKGPENTGKKRDEPTSLRGGNPANPATRQAVRKVSKTPSCRARFSICRRIGSSTVRRQSWKCANRIQRST